MNSAGNFAVTPLAAGALFVTKRMRAASAASLPRHRASVESVLVVTDGRCTIALEDDTHPLERGDSFVVPANVWHQITTDQHFTAVHVMPKEIRFDFSE